MLLTLTAFDGTRDVAPLVPLVAAAAPVTSIATSVTHTPPALFHTFTCSVCDPSGAVTGPSMYCAFQEDV